jgi:cytidylate kinase
VYYDPPMPSTVICISHTTGAGGEEIGRSLGERLGFRHVDEGILVEAARAKGIYPEAVALAESRSAGRQIEVDFGRIEKTETLRDLIRDAIATVADEGNAVIVAHAASYPLANRDGVMRVFVTAPLEVRVQRVSERDGIDEKTAAKRLKESDKQRAAYLKTFYGVDEEMPVHYDLVINTDRLDHGAAVDVLAAAATA